MTNGEMSSNKAAFLRFQDAMGSDDADARATVIDELVEPNAVIRTPLPIDASGANALKEVFVMLHRIYADLRITVKQLIEEGDTVVGVHSVTGTQHGEFMGVPPTGKSVTYDEVFVFRFVDGRIAETWGVVDVLAQMKQIGVTPAKGA